MRISTIDGDDAFLACKLLSSLNEIAILVDGIEYSHIFTADEENGYVIRRKMIDGNYTFGEDGNVITERIDGEVKIVLTPRNEFTETRNASE